VANEFQVDHAEAGVIVDDVSSLSLRSFSTLTFCSLGFARFACQAPSCWVPLDSCLRCWYTTTSSNGLALTIPSGVSLRLCLGLALHGESGERYGNQPSLMELQYSTEGKIKEPNRLADAGKGLQAAVASYKAGDMGGLLKSAQNLMKVASNPNNEAHEHTKATRTSHADVVSAKAV
jgi:hypothetical protein